MSKCWEDGKFGRAVYQDGEEFRRAVGLEVTRLGKQVKSQKRRHASMDKRFSEDSDAATPHDTGIFGRTNPPQIDVVALSEVRTAIEHLPIKERVVMRALANGHNAEDIAISESIGIHTVFRRIESARRMLFTYDLIGIMADHRANQRFKKMGL